MISLDSTLKIQVASADPLAVRDTEINKGWTRPEDKYDEFIAVWAAIVAHLNLYQWPKSSDKNDSLSACDEEQLPTHQSKDSSIQICKFISLQFPGSE